MKDLSVNAKAVRKDLKLPSYTKSEEIFNAISHGVGIIASVICAFFLFKVSPFNIHFLLCYSIYAITFFLLYSVSTIYHALPLKKIKSIFRKFDHCSIFLFIAGTYTPICMLLIKGKSGPIILIAAWIIAALGVSLNLIDVNKFAKLSLISYLTMGWLVVITFKPLIERLSRFQLLMLFGGGLAYTIGALIYVIGKKVKFMHSIWHIFVLIGSIFHFILVYSSSMNV
ncbi:MAG: hemolysin III family protein [Oscillospiraceae bacterium]|nr:hemolysin III family protein [Oscillospiraceae bacterium]